MNFTGINNIPTNTQFEKQVAAHAMLNTRQEFTQARHIFVQAKWASPGAKVNCVPQFPLSQRIFAANLPLKASAH